MCILFIAYQQHPKYPLIIAANRDEYFHRPSQTAHYWEDHPNILAGRDLKEGGTWLGTNTQGNLAAITNFRLPDLKVWEAKSRGHLVSHYLKDTLDKNNNHFEQYLLDSHRSYNPFNLLFGNPNKLSVFNSISAKVTQITPGFHSISNGQLDDYWPKMSRGVTLLREHIVNHHELHADKLAEIMKDSSPASDDTLPNTGIERHYERILSSIFIPQTLIAEHPYGTRTTSILLYQTKQLDFNEYNYSLNSTEAKQQHFQLML